MAFYQALPWHSGEDQIHKLTRIPHRDNPTYPMLSQNYALRVAASPTIALGTTDDDGNIWCTVWGGDLPIAQQVASGGVIGIKAPVDARFDPVVQTLYGGKDDGEILKSEGGQGRMVSGLSIQLEDRDRVKLFGRMVAGCLDATEVEVTESPSGQIDTSAKLTDTDTDTTTPIESQKPTTKIGTAQLVLHITQSLGNCPKYINKKAIKSHLSSRPQLLSSDAHLSPEAIAHVHSADIFFIASRGPDDMDCNHRGGLPGFIRVQPQSDTSSSPSISTLVWPEYSGNNLYQTLGNISYTPTIGLCIPNFVTGNVLYLTGQAQILLDQAATTVISKTRLAVQLVVSQARFVKHGLMFRGVPSTDNRDSSSSHPVVEREITDGMSPYNPRVRYLTSEVEGMQRAGAKGLGDVLPPNEYRNANNLGGFSATLTRKVKLTPTIMRYTFRLSSSDSHAFDKKDGDAKDGAGGATPLWTPGQYIALDFSEDLYMGYSHMRDDEPTSLNDDFIRTFTVATRYPDGASNGSGSAAGGKEVEFDIVIRSVGVVTRWLSRQNDKSGMTKMRVLGFAGEITFDGREEREGVAVDGRTVFIAAGIGITPLLAQLPASSPETDKKVTSPLSILWTLHISDIGLLSDVLPRIPSSLRTHTHIFVTGIQSSSVDSEDMKTLERLESEFGGVRIERRRLAKGDVTSLKEGGVAGGHGEAGEDGDVGGNGEGKGKVDKWIVCTAPNMRKEIQSWIGGAKILFENFDY